MKKKTFQIIKEILLCYHLEKKNYQKKKKLLNKNFKIHFQTNSTQKNQKIILNKIKKKNLKKKKKQLLKKKKKKKKNRRKKN